MNDYISWLVDTKTGIATSIARGTLRAVREKAEAVFRSPEWQEHGAIPCALRITRGARQYFVSSVILGGNYKP